MNPFPRNEITGGIKTMFRHVEMLQAIGFDASIYSPKGFPDWMDSTARLFEGANPSIDSGNLLVFPEVLNGPIAEAVQKSTAAAKALLCQNQYAIFNETIPRRTIGDLGFVRLMTVSEVAKGFLERTLAPATFDVLPVWIEHGIFFPREKSMRIAVFPRKMPGHYALIRYIFELKYPRFGRIPWDVIEGRPEQESAEALGRAAVFLSMSDRESVGLTPLEAMASGCVVVGFHGYGGLEYATDANGVWLRPDYLEETADALAQALLGIEQGDQRYHGLRRAGIATARRFNRATTEAALRHTFASLCS